MTHNVFGGTLNPTLLLLRSRPTITSINAHIILLYCNAHIVLFTEKSQISWKDAFFTVEARFRGKCQGREIEEIENVDP